MVKKRSLLILIMGVIFGCLLSCGIFALADSVKFKLGINLKPSVYFALSINIDNAGEQFIFDNRTTGANPVEDWATVKNLTLTLENDALSTAQNVELKVYNYNASKLMSFEVYDTAGGVLSTQQSGVKNITYGNYGVLNLKSIAVVNGTYSFKMVAEIYDQAIPKYDVIINNVYADEVYKNDNYTKVFLPENNYSIAVRSVEIAGVSTTNYSYEAATGLFEIAGAYVTGNVEITTKLVPLVWDGSVASEFSGGNGTENSPFEIRTGAELAYLAQVINSQATTVKSLGANYTITAGAEGVYFEQQNDIYLNDETFEFQADTGLVKVSDGLNTCYLGTFAIGDTSGSNSTFDSVETASLGAKFYDENMTLYAIQPEEISAGQTSYGASGILNVWNPIGDWNVEAAAFNGIFNGCNNNIYGLYEREPVSCKALFGMTNSENFIIKNIIVQSGYVGGSTHSSAIVGQNYNGGLVQNCINYSSVVGFIPDDKDPASTRATNTGGIVGVNDASLGDGINSKVENCQNYGSVTTRIYPSLWTRFGGVCGSNNGEILDCVNYGYLQATTESGGVCGWNTGIIDGAINKGLVYVVRNVGGVAGLNVGYLINSVNYATATGYPLQEYLQYSSEALNVGGVTGNTYTYENSSMNGKLLNCVNFGNVVCGYLSGGNSYSIGGVTGGFGLYGAGYVNNCYSIGTITSEYTTKLGGVYGAKQASGTISNCYWLKSGCQYAAAGAATADGCSEITTPSALMQSLNNNLASLAVAYPDVSFRAWTLNGSPNGYPILV